MIDSSQAYRDAVMADTRRTVVRVETDVVNPDITYGEVTASSKAAISVDKQLYNSHDEATRYATLERNFWILDGTADIYRDDYSRQEPSDKIGFVGDILSGADGTISITVSLNMIHPGLLQKASVYFSEDEINGIPVDFTVAVYAGDVLVYQWDVTDNDKYESESPETFEAYNPTKIVLTITKWSLANRRVRLRQMLPGFHLIWSGDDIASLTIEQNTDPSCVTLPYSRAKLSVDNSGKLFEPRNKQGFFRSIQARQIVEIYIGLLVGEEYEYRCVGKYYQHSGGWSSSDNGLSIDWDLVDIVGLLSEKEYVIPSPLPKTLEGWAESFVSHLGDNFTDRFAVDENYKNIRVEPPKKKAVKDKKIGDLIRYAGLASGTWARADMETGYLTFEPLWEQGVKITLHNMNLYPTMSENDDVGTVTITKPEIIDDDGTIIEEEKNIFGGTNTAASKNINIESPFIIDDNDVDRIFKQVITQCGGNAYDVTWRGDPCGECGDVVTFELDERNATSARLTEQTFDYSSGVLANCKAKLIQPQGYWTYASGTVIRESGTWTVPDGVNLLFVIVVGGGQAGEDGDDGSFTQDGLDGWDGRGGKIFAGGMNVVPGQEISVTIGAGSTSYSQTPGETAFGYFSSENGKVYFPSYTDIRSGSVYGRAAVKNPLPNTGDGGKGGKGGKKGSMHLVKEKDEYGFVTEHEVIDQAPGEGTEGSNGASGCVVIYWTASESSASSDIVGVGEADSMILNS